MIGRLEALPLSGGCCDRVLSVVVLEHTPEPGQVIEEFHRVLKPEGSVHLVVPLMWEEHQRPHDYFRYTSAGIRYLLERSGFRILSIRPVGGFFWQLGRRFMGILTFTQTGWRWILFSGAGSRVRSCSSLTLLLPRQVGPGPFLHARIHL